MDTNLNFADLSTNELEAALLGKGEAIARDEPIEDSSVNDEPEKVEDEFKKDEGVIDSENKEPASKSDLHLVPSNPIEARAREILSRNPDIKLEQAHDMAVAEIDPDNSTIEKTDEPSIEDRIAEIEKKLNEAGADEGLFTSEISQLTQEHSKLCAQKAVQQAREDDAAAIKLTELKAEREQSLNRAVASCPEALDEATPIGKSLSDVISEAEAENNPLLRDPRAPELFLAIANARLPEAERVELKRPTMKAAEKKTGNDNVKPMQAPINGALPVQASLNTAQHHISQPIDLSNLDTEISNLPTDVLEGALFGEKSKTTSPIFLRL